MASFGRRLLQHAGSLSSWKVRWFFIKVMIRKLFSARIQRKERGRYSTIFVSRYMTALNTAKCQKTNSSQEGKELHIKIKAPGNRSGLLYCISMGQLWGNYGADFVILLLIVSISLSNNWLIFNLFPTVSYHTTAYDSPVAGIQSYPVSLVYSRFAGFLF